MYWWQKDQSFRTTPERLHHSTTVTARSPCQPYTCALECVGKPLFNTVPVVTVYTRISASIHEHICTCINVYVCCFAYTDESKIRRVVGVRDIMKEKEKVICVIYSYHPVINKKPNSLTLTVSECITHSTCICPGSESLYWSFFIIHECCTILPSIISYFIWNMVYPNSHVYLPIQSLVMQIFGLGSATVVSI